MDAPDVQVYDRTWDLRDVRGHGTRMAGLALLGDLYPLLVSDTPVRLRHRLESVKILPDKGDNPPELYGFITKESAVRAEVSAPHRRRVFSLSVTSAGGDRGVRLPGPPPSTTCLLGRATRTGSAGWFS